MLTRYLFPHRLKWLGWVLVVVSATLGILHMTNTYQLPPLLPKLPALINDPVVTTHMPASSDQVVQFGSAEHSPRENTDLYAVLLIVGGVLAACSRGRNEDEYISQIRLDSLLWALYVYCALLALAFILVSGGWFFSVMTYAMFAPLLLFLLRFEIVLRLSSRGLADEK